MMTLDYLANGEVPISFEDATKLLPKRPNGRYPVVRTIERYAYDGLGPPGEKVFLEFAVTGGSGPGSRVTSKEAMRRFIARCTAAEQKRRQQNKERTRKERTCELASVG